MNPARSNPTLTYDELKFPNYVNSATALRLRTVVDGQEKMVDLSVCDLIYALEIAGDNLLVVSDTGKGKTQLMTDITWHHFNGDKETGNANFVKGRPNFEIEDLLVRQKVDLSSGKYDSDTARQLKTERTSRVFFGVDEINRAPKPKQNDFFDLAEGDYSFDGTNYELGKNGYAIFMAAANLNKLNGDFSGTFELDRALLNRAHATIDLDHPSFRPTPEDEMVIEKRKASPKKDRPKPQDLTDKIIAANAKIVEQSKSLDPYLTAFRFLIGRGLDYCDKDKYKEKGASFPTNCSDCDCTGKDLCSRVKGSSERTVDSVKPLAHALAYIAELKLGSHVQVDPLDAALQAFRFTTYHGNLNEVIANEEYAGRKQIMMDDTIEKLSKAADVLREYIPIILDGNEPVFVEYSNKSGKVVTARTDKLVKLLDDKKISYTEKSLKSKLHELGLGTDWVDAYTRQFKGCGGKK